jgi:hypothetical protein
MLREVRAHPQQIRPLARMLDHAQWLSPHPVGERRHALANERHVPLERGELLLLADQPQQIALALDDDALGQRLHPVPLRLLRPLDDGVAEAAWRLRTFEQARHRGVQLQVVHGQPADRERLREEGLARQPRAQERDVQPLGPARDFLRRNHRNTNSAWPASKAAFCS